MTSADGIIPGGGKVVLPLLALGGIALWINYYYGRRSTVISQEEIFEVDDTKEDYLSQLPDDVLSSILGNLTVRDAARTSILSTRWKYLFASMPTLRFKCLNMFGHYTFTHDCLHYIEDQIKFIIVVNKFLKLYSGRRVAHIEMDCCFVGTFPAKFCYCLRSISRLGVERLNLSFECFTAHSNRVASKLLQFPLENLCQASSLKHLCLSHCMVLSNPKVHFNSLMTLALRGVMFTSGHLEGILSSCSNLEKLTIENSKLPYKLRVSGTVTIVVILECVGGQEIDLHAAYLHTLECKIKNDVRFFFSFVPMLENVMVFPWLRPSYSYIIGDCARDLPDQVKSLTLKFIPDEASYFPIQNPTEMKMFRNLRKLSLILVTSRAILEIFELSRLLGDFPLLQYLSFVVIKVSRLKEIRGSRRPPPSPTCHTELKQVTYGGFNGLKAEMELVLYILRCAIVLEQMFLCPGYKSYFSSAPQTKSNVSFDEGKRNLIQQKLHGQAISRKAVVIIQ